VSINYHLDEVLKDLLSKPSEEIQNQQLVSCVDLTLLNENVSLEELTRLSHLVNQHRVAAVCVFPNDLVHFSPSSSWSGSIPARD
jgi:deoxyribose-phosphate aldolase